MEGERRKRKIEIEEENEEQKMERFFALIKRTKDVRDRFYKENKKMDGERERSVWNPKFEVEDFIDCGKMAESGKVSGSDDHHHDLAGPSHKELLHEKKEDLEDATQLVAAEEEDNGEEKDKRSEHLDLNLSL